MRRPRRGLIAALVAIATSFAIPATAMSTASGKQTFKGVIVKSGASGTETVVGSVVVAKGGFWGVGRVVEIDNLPGDPDNVTRDDLVFRAGSIHIRSVNVDFSLSLNPKTCIYKVRVEQTGTFEGGTKRFANATGSYTGTVRALGLARRDLAGECTLEQDPLFEVDKFAMSGSLSF